MKKVTVKQAIKDIKKLLGSVFEHEVQEEGEEKTLVIGVVQDKGIFKVPTTHLTKQQIKEIIEEYSSNHEIIKGIIVLNPYKSILFNTIRVEEI